MPLAAPVIKQSLSLKCFIGVSYCILIVCCHDRTTNEVADNANVRDLSRPPPESGGICDILRKKRPLPMPSGDAIKHWVSIRHLKHFLAHGDAVGLDSGALLKHLGISAAQLDDPEATLAVTTLEPLLEQLTAASPDHPIGLLLARDIQPATFGVLGLLTQSSPRFADVLELLVRYNGLLSDIGQVSLVPAPGRMAIRWECRAGSPRFRRHAREYVLASLVTLARALLPVHSDFPLMVSFPHPAPCRRAERTKYQDLFRCPVYFERPSAGIVVRAALLDQPLRHGDPAIRHALERHADELLRHRHQPAPLSGEVRRLLTAMLGEQDPSAIEIAHQLGLSERSLHRRLSAEGSSFQALLDAVRLARARVLLHESNAPLDEVAMYLGLQSRQSLIRWFRRHTGLTPGRYRKETSS
ncbi:MAG: hypothetical protein CL549_10365 [Alcanivorax sp.]|nr:hypothetical protein [Alcanivorax sp.]MAY10879.1 hypothetical protein [Alcanivorax sp.]HCE41295.1 hypothetical protein [Alcanivorax sp.]